MSYQIGQFRRTQLESYSTNLTFEMSTQENEDSVTSNNTKFIDSCMLFYPKFYFKVKKF